MALSFKPERAIYDAGGRMVRFFAHDDAILVHCGVTRRALAAVAADQSIESDDPLVLYRKLKTRIHAATRRKYQQHLREADGLIVVRRKDLSAV
jgi:hypothetical protein